MVKFRVGFTVVVRVWGLARVTVRVTATIGVKVRLLRT